MRKQVTRILCVHSGGKILRGSAWALLDILNALRRLNLQILLLCDQKVLADKATELGIDTEIIPSGEMMIDLPYIALHPLGLIRSNLAVRSKINAFRPDVVYCNGSRALQMSLAAIKLSGLPSVVHLHTPYSKRYLYTHGATSADATIHCSEKLRIFHEQKVKFKNSIAMKNAVQVENLPRLDSLMLQKRPEEPIIGFFGSLAHRKGLDILIDAFSETLKSGQRCRLKIGGHEDNDEYRNQVKNLGIQDFVEFKGEIPRSKVSDFFSDVSLHVLPSRSDAMPLSIIEAAMCGVPTIAHDIGGISESLLDGKLGILYKSNDSKSLKKIIFDVLEDRKLISEEKCIYIAQTARREFSLEENAKKMLSIFEACG